MSPLRLPDWLGDWVYHADWLDFALALMGLVLITLLIIWWRQQTRYWFRIVAATFLAALLLCIGSFYVFEVPPHYAGCPQGCPGWRGYPLPIARVEFNGVSYVAPLDFALNLLMLWLLWLGASLIWQLLGVAFQWQTRSRRGRVIFVLVFVVLPWAFLPRILNPSQPRLQGEDLRLAVNARRSAEFTYRITGFWVHRLALEDIRHTLVQEISQLAPGEEAGSQVCLRGYTYFYVPWRRYRITLDVSGVTALNLVQIPLRESCW
jgi:hypothetical protein